MVSKYTTPQGKLYFGDRLLGEVVRFEPSTKPRLDVCPGRETATLPPTLAQYKATLRLNSEGAEAMARLLRSMAESLNKRHMSKRAYRRWRGKRKAKDKARRKAEAVRALEAYRKRYPAFLDFFESAYLGVAMDALVDPIDLRRNRTGTFRHTTQIGYDEKDPL